MKIGLNLLYLIPGVVGGTETYAAGLIHGLAQIDNRNEYFVFVNREAAKWPLPAAGNFTRVVCPVNAVSRVRRYYYEQMQLPGLLKAHSIEFIHSLGYVAPLFPPCPSVVTVPDMNYRAFGSRMPPIKQMALGFFVQQSVRRADHVITISNFARGQILSMLGINSEKITVTLLAPSPAVMELSNRPEILRKYEIKQPYIIAFSSSSPHKNIPRLVQAFVRARQDRNLSHQLVLLGHRPANMAIDLDIKGVVSTGYVNEHSRNILLEGAELLVFPSTYEGFGLPVLEAQQVGAPVACSNAASLPEVAGDGAVFFDPLSIDQMAGVIGQCLSNPVFCDELRRRGQANVRRFSWERTARATLAVYTTVATRR